MTSEPESIFASRFEENCQQHQDQDQDQQQQQQQQQEQEHQYQHQHLRHEEVDKVSNGKPLINSVSRCTITINQSPIPILEPTLAQTSCGASGNASGLDRTKRQGLISTHGTEELDTRESGQFTSTNKNNSPPQCINVDIPISSSSHNSNSWPASVYPSRDRDGDLDIQGTEDIETQRRVSTASSATLLSTPQLSPLSPSPQASKHSRVEDNVSERILDITLSEPPVRFSKYIFLVEFGTFTKLKPFHLSSSNDTAQN